MEGKNEQSTMTYIYENVIVKSIILYSNKKITIKCDCYQKTEDTLDKQKYQSYFFNTAILGRGKVYLTQLD